MSPNVITSDLRSSRELMPIGPENARVYSYPEATAPSFTQWRTTGAKALVTGFVQARSDGRITVACYLHDIPDGAGDRPQGLRRHAGRMAPRRPPLLRCGV